MSRGWSILGHFVIIEKTYRNREVLYLKEHSIDIQLSHPDDLFHLFGSNERHLRLMEQELDVIIHARTKLSRSLGKKKIVRKLDKSLRLC